MAISEPTCEFQVDQNVAVPMRDGTILRADVYRPKIEGQYPVIVERTQGWRSEGGYHQCQVTGRFFAPRGYAYVAQNMRGTFGSEGQFYFGRNDAWDLNRDGYDTIEWAARQPWSNGRVAMCVTNCPARAYGPGGEYHGVWSVEKCLGQGTGLDERHYVCNLCWRICPAGRFSDDELFDMHVSKKVVGLLKEAVATIEQRFASA